MDKLIKFSNKYPHDIHKMLHETRAPFDACIIAMKMGIKVKESFKFSKQLLCGEIRVINKKPVIWLNNTIEREKSLLLAYMIGKVVFEVLPALESGEEVQPIEIETINYKAINPIIKRAIIFANTLIMPSFAIKDEMRELIQYYKEQHREKIPKSFLLRPILLSLVVNISLFIYDLFISICCNNYIKNI